MFVLAVARHRVDVKADLDAAAVRPGVGGRKIAEDAAPDLPALGLHPDRFGDQEIAVALDRDVADEIEDTFLRRRRAERREQQDQRAPKQRFGSTIMTWLRER